MSTPSPIIQPGISVLVNDVFDLNPSINLLPGANVFYSAYPAAEGKVGIYTKWEGENGAQQAVHGVPQGVAPHSTTWNQAVDTLRSRYTQLNPPGAGITSVLVVRDSDHSDNEINTSTQASTAAATGDDGPFGRVLNMLDALPTHVLDTARQRRLHSASGATTISPGGPPNSPFVSKPISFMSPMQTNPVVPQVSGKCSQNQFATPSKSKPMSGMPNINLKIADNGSPNTIGPPNHRPQVSNMSPSTAFTAIRPAGSSSPHRPGSTAIGLIDSPLRGVGISQFMAPVEAYAIGYWTRTILQFIQCEEEVIPVVERHLCRFCYDKDDIEFQVALSKVFAEQLSHLVVKLLKLDAYFKMVGRNA